ncbi:UNKNOWN [Stylonychia lemnae]|uniref:Uncharacterized protein n=1 Tax=Stylonychia lemnae TaxID=5949 RepID=A0A078AUL3_STYLE|nr:UNKNOWN [Stylonychia lemnae]|eukprot:CDW84917.1 UNKNOWN [Stylonychia lemnae]
MENQQPLKSFRSSSSKREDQFATDIKQLLVERHSLKRRIKGTESQNLLQELPINNMFKRPNQFRRDEKGSQPPPSHQKPITPIKSQRSNNNGPSIAYGAGPVSNFDKQSENKVLEDFQNLLINLSNCKSNNNKSQMTPFQDQNINPNQFFSEIIGEDPNFKRNYEIRLQKIQNRLRQRLGIYLDQIEINIIEVLHSIRPNNQSIHSQSQSMISDQSIFENGDDLRLAKVKEIKNSCKQVIQNLEEASGVLKETLNIDTNTINDDKIEQQNRDKIKKQFFKLRQDVLTSDSIKRQCDRKERQLLSQISQQESILVQKDHQISDLQQQLDDLSMALRTHQELLQQQDLQLQDQFQNTQQIQNEYSQRQMQTEEKLIELQRMSVKLEQDKRELEDTLQRERNSLQQQLEIIKDSKNRVEQNNATLSQKLDLLQKSQQDSQSNQIRELTRKLQEKFDEIQLLSSDKNRFEQQLDLQKKENKIISEDVLNLKSDLNESKQQVSEKTMKLQEQEHLIKQLESQLQLNDRRLQEYQTQSQLYQKEIENLKVTIEEKKREIIEQKSKIQRYEQDISNLKSNAIKSDEYIQSLRVEKESMQVQLDQKEFKASSQKDHLIQELQDHRILNIKLDAELKLKQEQYSFKAEEISKLNEILKLKETEQEQLNQHLNQSKQIVEDLKIKQSELTYQNSQQKSEIQQHQLKQQILEQDIKLLQNNILEMKTLELVIKQKEQCIDQLNQQIQNENQKYLKQYQDHQDLLEKQYQQIDNLGQKMQSLKLELDEKVKCNIEQEAQIKTITGQNLQLIQKVEKYQSKIRQIQQQKTEDIQAVKENVNKIIEIKETEIQTMLQRTKALDDEITLVQENIIKQKQDHKLQIENYKQLLENKQKDVESRQNELEQKINHIKQQEVEINGLSQLINEHQRHHKILETKIQSLKTKLLQSTQENQRVKQASEAQLNDNMNLQRQIELIIQEKEHEKQLMMSDLAMLKDKVNELNQIEPSIMNQLNEQKQRYELKLNEKQQFFKNEIDKLKNYYEAQCTEKIKQKYKELNQLFVDLQKEREAIRKYKVPLEQNSLAKYSLTVETDRSSPSLDMYLSDNEIKQHLSQAISIFQKFLQLRHFNQTQLYEDLKSKFLSESGNNTIQFDFEAIMNQTSQDLEKIQAQLSNYQSLQVKDIITKVLAHFITDSNSHRIQQEAKSLIKDIKQLFKVNSDKTLANLDGEVNYNRILDVLRKEIDENEYSYIIKSYLQISKDNDSLNDKIMILESKFQEFTKYMQQDKDNHERVFTEQLQVLRKERDEGKSKIRELEIAMSMKQPSTKSVYQSQIFENVNQLSPYNTNKPNISQMNNCLSQSSLAYQSNKSTDFLSSKESKDIEINQIHKYYKDREKEYLKMIDQNQKEVQRLRNLLVN